METKNGYDERLFSESSMENYFRKNSRAMYLDKVEMAELTLSDQKEKTVAWIFVDEENAIASYVEVKKGFISVNDFPRNISKDRVLSNSEAEEILTKLTLVDFYGFNVPYWLLLEECVKTRIKYDFPYERHPLLCYVTFIQNNVEKHAWGVKPSKYSDVEHLYPIDSEKYERIDQVHKKKRDISVTEISEEEFKNWLNKNPSLQ